MTTISKNNFPQFEPYHEFVIQVYNNNLNVIQNIQENGYKNNQLNLSVWMNAITVFMIYTEQYKQLTGPTKKRIIIDVCFLIIDNSPLIDENKYTLKLLLQSFLPTAIDSFVELSNNKN